MPDLFATLLDGVIERDDAVDAAGKRAGEVDAAEVIAAALTGEDLVQEVMRRGVLASAEGLRAQLRMARDLVAAEGKALAGADAASLAPITDVDVAARRAAKQLGADAEKAKEQA